MKLKQPNTVKFAAKVSKVSGGHTSNSCMKTYVEKIYVENHYLEKEIWKDTSKAFKIINVINVEYYFLNQAI